MEPSTPPSPSVKFAIDGKEVSGLKQRPLFLQLNDYIKDESGKREWRESARWIKFEETVEYGGNRWSKPHVGSMSLHYVFELRSILHNCTMCLDMTGDNLEEICNSFLDPMQRDGTLSKSESVLVKKTIITKHKQQFESGLQNKLPGMISFAKGNGSVNNLSETNPILIPELSNQKLNHHFFKKIPKLAETTNILVGEITELSKPICAFVRLTDPVIFNNLTEVPVPTRFIFVMLGPPSKEKNSEDYYHQIGRAVGCIMSEEIFSKVAYTAKTREDLLEGLEKFLHELTVLPPGKWDPSIRVEPPAVIPPRKSSMIMVVDEEEEAAILRKEAGLVRTGRLFGGLINDVKRKAPFYLSDFTDAFSMQCISTYFFIYFACLTPIVTFGGLLGDATENRMAAMESLMSGLVVGVGYGFFSGQPLTIMGSTGPILVFEALIFSSCKSWEWDYLSFRLCIGLWVGILLFILVALDASAFVCYITRFTEENFALLIASIFIVKAFEKLHHISMDFPYGVTDAMQEEFCYCDAMNKSLDSVFQKSHQFDKIGYEYSHSLHKNTSMCQFEINDTLIQGIESPYCHPRPDVHLMSVILCLSTFAMSFFLKKSKETRFFPSTVRRYISDFAVLIAIGSMTWVDYHNGLDTPKLTVPEDFRPTWDGRGWIIHPLGKNPWWSILVAIFPALLATILIFMDQQITSVIVNRKENKLLKGCGYHLDLLVVLILIMICSVFGLPWFVAATVLAINHVKSLSKETETSAPGDKPQFLGIREQRVTHILIFITVGLSVFMRNVLGKIPMPVLYGVFLYMGIASLDGLQFFNRILLIFMPKKYQPDYPYLRKIPPERVHLFTLIQFACFAMLWIIKTFKETSILFPLMLVVMIGVRKLLDYVFTKEELRILDDVLPEFKRKQKIEMEEQLEKEIHDEETMVGDRKSIVVTSPACNLLCTDNSIEVTLDNGNVMTIPIEGNINFDVSNSTGLTSNRRRSFQENLSSDPETGFNDETHLNHRKRKSFGEMFVGTAGEVSNLLRKLDSDKK